MPFKAFKEKLKPMKPTVSERNQVSFSKKVELVWSHNYSDEG